MELESQLRAHQTEMAPAHRRKIMSVLQVVLQLGDQAEIGPI